MYAIDISEENRTEEIMCTFSNLPASNPVFEVSLITLKNGLVQVQKMKYHYGNG